MTAQFYVLSNIRKECNGKLPLCYPRRLIVSVCNSPTDRFYKFIDKNIQPYTKALPSYIKDTSDITFLEIAKRACNSLWIVIWNLHMLRYLWAC